MNSNKQNQRNSRIIAYFLAVVAYIGFLDASYLTFKHYDGTAINCFASSGCDLVARSEYSVLLENIPLIGSFPVSLLGAFFYLTVLLLVIHWFFSDQKNRIVKIMPLIGLIAFLASVRFVFLQIYVIQAICVYCMISAFTSSLIFLLALLWRFYHPHAKKILI